MLKDEITNDPLSRGYSTMSDLEVVASLNKTIDRPIKFLSGSDIFNATDDEEYAALTDIQKSSWDALCAIDSINTSSGVAKAREAELFGGGTATRANLLALKNNKQSRAQELGLGRVRDFQVAAARI